MVEECALRILLECILVSDNFVIYLFCAPTVWICELRMWNVSSNIKNDLLNMSLPTSISPIVPWDL